MKLLKYLFAAALWMLLAVSLSTFGADSKITALPSQTSAAPADELPFVKMSPTPTTSNITIQNFLTGQTLSTTTLSGTTTNGGTVSGGTVAPTTLTVPSGTTIPSPTVTGTVTATGSTYSGGTMAPTALTVPSGTSLPAPTITGTATATGATISGGTVAPTTLTVPSGTTLPSPTVTGTMTATGATISGGTVSPTTLTVPAGTIPSFTSASSVGSSDLVPISQAGTNKTATGSVFAAAMFKLQCFFDPNIICVPNATGVAATDTPAITTALLAATGRNLVFPAGQTYVVDGPGLQYVNNGTTLLPNEIDCNNSTIKRTGTVIAGQTTGGVSSGSNVVLSFAAAPGFAVGDWVVIRDATLANINVAYPTQVSAVTGSQITVGTVSWQFGTNTSGATDVVRFDPVLVLQYNSGQGRVRMTNCKLDGNSTARLTAPPTGFFQFWTTNMVMDVGSNVGGSGLQLALDNSVIQNSEGDGLQMIDASYSDVSHDTFTNIWGQGYHPGGSGAMTGDGFANNVLTNVYLFTSTTTPTATQYGHTSPVGAIGASTGPGRHRVINNIVNTSTAWCIGEVDPPYNTDWIITGNTLANCRAGAFWAVGGANIVFGMNEIINSGHENTASSPEAFGGSSHEVTMISGGNSFSITGASWAASVVTFTSTTSGIVTGESIGVQGVSPAGYNGTYTVTGVTGTTVTAAMTTNPGAYSSGGTLMVGVDAVATFGNNVWINSPLFITRGASTISMATQTFMGGGMTRSSTNTCTDKCAALSISDAATGITPGHLSIAGGTFNIWSGNANPTCDADNGGSGQCPPVEAIRFGNLSNATISDFSIYGGETGITFAGTAYENVNVGPGTIRDQMQSNGAYQHSGAVSIQGAAAFNNVNIHDVTAELSSSDTGTNAWEGFDIQGTLSAAKSASFTNNHCSMNANPVDSCFNWHANNGAGWTMDGNKMYSFAGGPWGINGASLGSSAQCVRNRFNSNLANSYGSCVLSDGDLEGTVALVGGAATVSTSRVTASSRILLTSQADGGTPGFLRVSTRTAGTSFTITSSSGTDTSTVLWKILDTNTMN